MPRRRIDVHRHIVPPAYADWLAVDDALATMDGHDIARAVVSISTPGVYLRAGDHHPSKETA